MTQQNQTGREFAGYGHRGKKDVSEIEETGLLLRSEGYSNQARGISLGSFFHFCLNFTYQSQKCSDILEEQPKINLTCGR